MIWAAITKNGVAAVVPIRGTLNGVRYLDILKANLPSIVQRDFPLPRLAGTEPVFQHDNAPCHKFLPVERWLRQEATFKHMHWPPYSPDLNPIENLWPMLKDAVRRRGQAANLDQLWENIQAVVAELNTPQWTRKIRNLYESMPRRIQAVIDANGYQTKY